MAKKVLLLHGWGGSDFPHWQSWLAAELAKDYGCVNFLRFSDVENPKLELWLKELQTALLDFKPDIVICHSLANTLWFHLCNQNKIANEIEKLYLVAPPSIECSIAELSEFFPVTPPKYLFSKKSLLITSTNDPYLSMTEANELQKVLAIPMYTIENGGHINADSGYGEWQWIQQELKDSSF